MGCVKYLLTLLLLSIVFTGFVYAEDDRGRWRRGSSSNGRYYDANEYLRSSYPAGVYRGYGRKSSGHAISSSRPKGHEIKSYSATESDGSKKEARIIEYGQGTPSAACQRFLSESSGPRQEFERKRAVHLDAREDPRAAPAELEAQRQEIRQLYRSIEATNRDNCRWVY